MNSLFRLTGFRAGFLLLFCFGIPSFGAVGGHAQSVRQTTAQSVRTTKGRSAPTAATAAVSPSDSDVVIPGPLRSFLRMAGISQKVSPGEVVPLLARNTVVEGYQQGKPTEFLNLVKRYLQQARELEDLAGSEQVIRVENCQQAKPLLEIIGYKPKPACGPDSALETSDPDRAFLTIDSGFPLSNLEQTLQGGEPFVFPYPRTRVPVIYTESDWNTVQTADKGARRKTDDLIDLLLRDPELARLYWALSRIDSETRADLRESPGLQKLLPHAAVLDFYGSTISIRSGRVQVPGGAGSEHAWKELVGADPASPGEFVPRLLAKDDGWLATYYDAVSRVDPVQQAYFADPRRLPRFYDALKGKGLSPGPAKPVFRPDADLLLLMTRLYFDPSGEPHVPGNLETWRDQLHQGPESKAERDYLRRSSRLNNPDDLVEAMIALSRMGTKDGPVPIYLTLSEMDRERTPDQRLTPQVARLLIGEYPRFSDQYLIFTEFNGLNNESIERYISVAKSVDRITEHTLRTNTLGILQANVGLWEIFARQDEIPDAVMNESWQRVISPFSKIVSSPQLFDAGRDSFRALAQAVTGKPDVSEDGFVDALAGPAQLTPDGQQMRADIAARIRAVLEAQRLVSTDTLLALGDGLNRMAQGKAGGDSLIPLARELREFEMPQPIFTSSQKTEWGPALDDTRHAQSELRTDLTKVINSSSSPDQLMAARGLLVPFLRDTLVGLNYAYYEPPGAQMLHNNPLLVRSHDFSGGMTATGEEAWQTPRLFDRGWTASGGAHLAGSLADLPYALSRVEQDFIVPESVQSLVWEDLVPTFLTEAVVARWWDVTPHELHAVALYQRSGEELLENASKDERTRQAVMKILSARMLPERSDQIEGELRTGQMGHILDMVTPADTFFLTAEFRREFPGQTGSFGPAGKELEELSKSAPAEVSWERISHDFGSPHPALAQTYSRELLNLKPFPTFMGYSSRLLAESWESNNLYWGRLADEMGYSPVMLNRLVPDLTRRMVAKIFATDLEDWPAVLRALHETGDEFRRDRNSLASNNSAPEE